MALLEAGWQQVVIITDHGWLLLPGGLPKAELPELLTTVRKARCARLKPLAATDQRTVPWFWDAECGSPCRRASPATRPATSTPTAD